MPPAKTLRSYRAPLFESLESRQLMSVVTLNATGGNDTTNIQNAAKNSHVGDTIAFNKGNYHVSGTLLLPAGRTYVGNGSSIQGSGGNLLRIDGTLAGGGQTDFGGFTLSSGVSMIDRVDGIKFHNNTIQNVSGNGIMIANWINHGSISNNSFTNISGTGVYGYCPNNTSIDHNKFDYAYEGVHILYYSHGANNAVSYNKVTHATRHGIELQSSPQGLIIEGNWIDNWLPHVDASGTDSHIGISCATGIDKGVTSKNIFARNNYVGGNGIARGAWATLGIEIGGQLPQVYNNIIYNFNTGVTSGSITGAWYCHDNKFVGLFGTPIFKEGGGMAPADNLNNQRFSAMGVGGAPAVPAPPV